MVHRQVARLFLFFTVGLVVGCNSDRSTGISREAVSVETGMADLWANDHCTFDPSWACHGEPVLFWYFSNATLPYGDPSFDCPDGCTTYPLGVGTKSRVKDMIDHHISADPACAWAKTFLLTSYNYGRIRWYDYDDGNWGDSHFSSNSPVNSDIHIWTGTFADAEELGLTLIHEAAHINFTSGDESYVEAWANLCYVP
jgi:hypothetical protein